MPQPYDSATKFLLDNPADWLPLVHRPVAEATPLNSDLSTITASADKLFRVHSEPPYVLHLELQSTYQTRMAERFMMYNVLIHYREQLPVLSVVVLLRPEADGTCMREPVRLHLPDESESYLRFRFEVVRLDDC